MGGMLRRYEMSTSLSLRTGNYEVYAQSGNLPVALEADKHEWVTSEDAAALERRIAELERQLQTEADKREEFERNCG